MFRYRRLIAYLVTHIAHNAANKMLAMSTVGSTSASHLSVTGLVAASHFLTVIL